MKMPAHLNNIRIHELFEKQALQTPNAIALISQEQVLTYQELNQKANQLSHHLRKIGVGPNVFVGICVERSLKMIIGILGILKAEGAYVPFDPAYPADRLAYMMEDTQVPIMLTQKHLMNELPPSEAKMLLLDEDWDLIAKESTDSLCTDGTSSHYSYVNYTSGSTGKPKGVLIPHRAVVRLVKEANFHPFSSDETFLQFAPISFDAATFEIWGSLLNGAKLVIFPAHVASLEEVGRFVNQQQVTTLWLTAGLFHQMVDHHLDYLSDLRYLYAGGDVLSPSHVKKVLERFPGITMVNGYGPTENTVFTTCYVMNDSSQIGKSVSIGRSISYTELYVLDENRNLVPDGEVGELYVGGDGLAVGYLNQPELTAEKFVPSPFAEDPDARLYRTGDLVRKQANDCLEFLGRIDHQVKIRGYRIELGEIESQLIKHPSVQDVVVIVREDFPGDKRIIAYWIATSQFELSELDLQEFVSKHLPSFMVPSAFVKMDSFPLTANGKVDRKQLPKPTRAAFTRPYEAPFTALEQSLAGIWSEVLDIERVGLADSFFELGGHSLLATKVLTRIRQTFGVELNMGIFFEDPQLHAVATHLQEALQAGPSSTAPKIPLVRQERQGQFFPLSSAQEQLWILDQLSDERLVYNVNTAFKLQGPLDHQLLETSIQKVIQRHEALRTTFVQSATGTPMQFIVNHIHIPLMITNLTHLPSAEQSQQVEVLLADYVRHPFDLSTGPLIRPVLLQIQEQEHILLLLLHHIISDGWSIGILNQEISAFYQAAIEGTEPSLRPLSVQYADYAVWQKQSEANQNWQDQLQYWQRQLTGAPPLLELRIDFPRPVIQRYRGAVHSFLLPQNLYAQLQELAQKEQVTLYMVLLTAFQSLLHRYIGQEDLLVGSHIAGRGHTEIEYLIGYFVNTLVLRADFSGHPTFCDLLRQVRNTTLEGYSNQDLRFETLVKALQPERNLSYNPLFQAAFVLQNAEMNHWNLPNVTVQPIEVENGTAKFDISLLMEETADGLVGKWEYNTDLFKKETMERMTIHLEKLLHYMVTNLHQTIASAPLITDAEQNTILSSWNNTAIPLSENSLLHNLFEQQAKLNPDAVAVSYGEEHLTYQELDMRANQLAHQLQRCGVTRNSIVSIHMERSLQLVVALLGTLKAGGAYLPLDPSYPTERLSFMLEDSNSCVLLTEQSLSGRLSLPAGHVISLDTEWTDIASNPVQPPTMEQETTDMVYLIYTSGSTGTPKGVQIPHRAICNHMLWMNKEFPLDSSSKVLQKTPFSFDASVWEFYAPLLSGAELVMATPNGHADPEYLIQTIKERKITTLQLVPTMLQMLIGHPEFKTCTHLQCVFCGGEKLTFELQERFFNTLPTAYLINLYGPTETCIDATFWVCQRDAFDEVPIGRPIANTQTYVLDVSLQPVPIGVPGELFIGGHGLALGYLNRPELTDDRFVSNPFVPGGRMYKTGDFVRYREDGVLEYMGRIDQQVKLRGLRIELGDIESTLLLHPDVREAVVIVHEDVPGNQLLTAYIVHAAGAEPKRKGLEDGIKNKLPSYMLPNAYVLLSALPLTPNGKVDKKSLPAPDRNIEYQGEDFTEARSAVEAEILAIWSDILGISPIGINSNFFDLGGHSLSATQVISRIRELFEVEIGLRDLFSSPTVAELACAVEMRGQLRTEIADDRFTKIEGTQSELHPLSYAQQRLWFLDQLEQESHTYNIPYAVHCYGHVDQNVLEQVLAEIVHRHHVLCTTFVNVEGEPRQTVVPDVQISLPVEDLRALPEVLRTERAQSLLQAEATSPFNLSYGPLWRAKLIHLSDQEHHLLLTLHHIITDGWSMGLLLQEIATLYQAYAEGKPSPLLPLDFQYADYANWQRQALKGERLDQHLSFWKKQLAGAPPLLELTIDFPRPAVQSYRGAYHAFALPKSLGEKLKKLAQQEKVTFYFALLAAFQSLLFRYTQQADILVGSPVAGRVRRETESMIGLFVNTLVMRSNFSGNPSYRELLEQVREMVLDAFQHQELPFDRLVEELQPTRDMSYNPIFQVMFDFIEQKEEELQLPGLRLLPQVVLNHASKFDLTMEIKETSEGLYGTFEYSTDLFKASTVARMAGHFQTILEGMVANPDAPISTLTLLTQEEHRQIIGEWNSNELEFDNRVCLHELFEIQAVQTPHREATKFGEEAYTYQELNEQANRIAHHLQAFGVGPDDLFGIYMERSLEMVAAALGVLKAGGAYVPLDPAYPKDRLQNMLQVSRPKAILTQESLLSDLPANSSHIVCLNQSEITQQTTTTPSSPVQSKHLAYVIFTSGTTGQPKGVMVQHDTLVNAGTGWRQEYELDQHTRILNVASISFDVFAGDFVKMIFSGGGCLVICPQETRLDMSSLHHLMYKEGITLLDGTPGLIIPLMEHVHHQQLALPQLKTLIFGADYFPMEDYRTLMHRFRNQYRILNGYGITETTIESSYFESTLEEIDPNAGGYVPIGRPLPNSCFYILDEHLNPHPVGLTGELYIAGVGITRGYFKRPDLTAERFVDNPFLPGQKMYKTGDMAKYREDGNVEFLGRIDHQIKIRGFRIELGEIEYLLIKHPSIQEAVVVAQASISGHKQLVGFLVAKEQPEPSTDEIFSYLKSQIPAYMVPSSLVWLEELPVTPNGKTDRRALLQITVAPAQATRGYIAEPRDMIEQELVKIWESTLNMFPISIRNNFFDLGGHSLLVIQMLAKINKSFGKEIPVAHVMQGGTIEEIAVLLRREGNLATYKHVVPVQPNGSKPPIFFMHHVGGYFFNLAYLFKLLDPDQPIYAMKICNPAGDYATVEELAIAYAKEIQEVVPQGPYLFAGHSYGGLAAYEVAKQIQEQGHEVNLVAIFDTYLSREEDRDKDPFFYQMEYASRFRLKFVEDELRQLPYEDQIQFLLRLAKESKYVTPDAGLQEIENEMKIWTMHSKAADMYVPSPTSNPLVVFRAVEEEIDSTLGWTQLSTTSCEIVQVPGTHASLVRPPHVVVLVKELSERISQANQKNKR